MVWEVAIEAWRSAIGEAHVVEDEKVRKAAETATFATHQLLRVVLEPADQAEVQACMAIAHAHKCPVYPVSQGKNWGLGSRVPPHGECALLSLARLNQIVEFNEKLGYMVVEPGVTFRQGHAFLAAEHSRLMLSVIGGTPDASIIGNIVERGDGVGPYGDRLNHTCAMEVVLPDGSLLHTGFGRFPGAHAVPVGQWGVGPAMDGLFTQSNLGVVTRLTVWLCPRPAWFQLFVGELDDPTRLAGMIDALQPLVLQGVLQPNALTIWNSYKLAARMSQYPWEQSGGKTPMPPQALSQVAPWYACGAHYCASQAHGVADQQVVRIALTPYVDRLAFQDQASHPGILEGNPLLGVPYDDNVASAYWRKKRPPPYKMDPDRDRCGVHWLCPIFPFDGELIASAIAEIEALTLDHGFEPNLGISCTSGRTARMFIAVMYDRDVPGEDERAMAWHDAMLDALFHSGHILCRLGIQSMSHLPPGVGAYNATLQQIKATLDPHGILAPGRYEWSPSCSKK